MVELTDSTLIRNESQNNQKLVQVSMKDREMHWSLSNPVTSKSRENIGLITAW